MNAHPLPTGTPASQGVDALGVDAFLDAVEVAPDIEPHSLMILRHGHVVASGWWAPYTADRLNLLYSLSKSFTSTAAGFAAAEGLVDLDAPVISYFPEFEADITHPASRSMLVRHVASMASGHCAETHEQALTEDPDELVRGFLLLPPDREPGTVFAYNQPCTYTLAAIVQRVTGQSLTEYLRPRLFDPLGIGEVAWQQDAAGREVGFSGLHATTDAIARLGLLYLRGGVWEGRRLLPAWWVAEATRPQIANADGPSEGAPPDWQQGYGFQFWMCRHGYRGDGAYGQFCLVLPEHDAVIAITAATERMQAVLDAAWDHLLPAFGPAPLDAGDEADAALRERLARLELPQVQAKSGPVGAPELWLDTRFAPAGGTCADQPALAAVEITADGTDGWKVSLIEDGARFALRFEGTRWTVQAEPDVPVPAAVSAGWTDADTLVADVAFLETPHHLVVTCSLATHTFQAHWRTMPLASRLLRRFGAPRRPSY